jgi:hypothetical protein
MNDLRLPPAPPLPDEVRERVLRTVLVGTRAPRRRLTPLVAAVLAVVATLALTTSVATSIGGGPAAQREGAASPGPPPPSPQDRDGEERAALEVCLVSTLTRLAGRTGVPHTVVLNQDAYGRTPRALVGRTAGQAAVCYLGADGPVAAAGDLDPTPQTHIVGSERRDGLVVALVRVAPGVERVEIASSPRPGSTGSGAACTLADGLALCMLPTDGPVNVSAFTGEAGRLLPVP